VDENTTPAERQRLRHVGGSTYYRVDTTNRSSDLPPLRVPHNFGICNKWYEEKRRLPQFKEILADWEKWPRPPGWEEADGRQNAISEESAGDGYIAESVGNE
jgi:hypothetical protein